MCSVCYMTPHVAEKLAAFANVRTSRSDPELHLMPGSNSAAIFEVHHPPNARLGKTLVALTQGTLFTDVDRQITWMQMDVSDQRSRNMRAYCERALALMHRVVDTSHYPDLTARLMNSSALSTVIAW